MRSESLVNHFEEERPRLWAMAYRLTGSVYDADDALQSGWMKTNGADAAGTFIDSPAAWLTTVVSREALGILRGRRRRAEVPLESAMARSTVDGPESDALQVESVGRALLVVLSRLTAAQRVAYVLHDMFAVPFAEIADTLDTSPAAAKKLASRARARVGPPAADPRLQADREVVEAYLAASRAGDIDRLLRVLAPDVVRTADAGAMPTGTRTVRGARTVAGQTRAFSGRARVSVIALVDKRPALLVAPHGILRLAMLFTVRHGQVAEIQIVSAPALNHAEIRLAVPSSEPV